MSASSGPLPGVTPPPRATTTTWSTSSARRKRSGIAPPPDRSATGPRDAVRGQEDADRRVGKLVDGDPAADLGRREEHAAVQRDAHDQPGEVLPGQLRVVDPQPPSVRQVAKERG